VGLIVELDAVEKRKYRTPAVSLYRLSYCDPFNRSTVAEFIWRYLIKPVKPSVSIAGVLVEIRAKNLPNI
jgi:hypothetical protein